MMGLVEYPSDSDEAETPPRSSREDGNRTGPEEPRKRRRLLPSLPSSFAGDTTVDDPSLHQGRTRSRPFVIGEYNAHIYIEQLSKALDDLLQEAIELVCSLCPKHTINSLLRTPASSTESTRSTDAVKSRKLPLHISLTHPLALRRDQIATFKSDLIASMRDYRKRDGTALRLSLAKDVIAYVNGRRYGGEGSGGRAFLAVRIAAGASELEDMVEKVMHPLLDTLHLPRYHSNPEFHASFAWCLLDSTLKAPPTDNLELLDTPEWFSAPPDSASPPTPFTPAVLEHINREFSDRLITAQPTGGWEVNHLELKIAKETRHITL